MLQAELQEWDLQRCPLPDCCPQEGPRGEGRPSPALGLDSHCVSVVSQSLYNDHLLSPRPPSFFHTSGSEGLLWVYTVPDAAGGELGSPGRTREEPPTSLAFPTKHKTPRRALYRSLSEESPNLSTGRNVNDAAPVENRQFLKKLSIELLHDPVIPLLGM